METKNNEHTIIGKLIKKLPVLAIAGMILGSIGGYIYYAKVGCVSGTCAITSNPWMSTAWGGAFGYLIFDMFNGRKKKEKDSVQSN